ncbi:hypothetical protein [Ruminococcus sp.]|nr:hypothetical protein [Ruminococcus sp.]
MLYRSFFGAAEGVFGRGKIIKSGLPADRVSSKEKKKNGRQW